MVGRSTLRSSYCSWLSQFLFIIFFHLTQRAWNIKVLVKLRENTTCLGRPPTLQKFITTYNEKTSYFGELKLRHSNTLWVVEDCICPFLWTRRRDIQVGNSAKGNETTGGVYKEREKKRIIRRRGKPELKWEESNHVAAVRFCQGSVCISLRLQYISVLFYISHD